MTTTTCATCRRVFEVEDVPQSGESRWCSERCWHDSYKPGRGEAIGAALFLGVFVAGIVMLISSAFLYSVVLKTVLGVCVGSAVATAYFSHKVTSR